MTIFFYKNSCTLHKDIVFVVTYNLNTGGKRAQHEDSSHGHSIDVTSEPHVHSHADIMRP